MSAESLAMVASVLLSLAFSYIPKSDGWWANLDGVYKRLIMLGLLLVVAAASFGLGCAGLSSDLGMSITCDRAGLVGLIRAFILAVMANQAAYQVTPQTAAKK